MKSWLWTAALILPISLISTQSVHAWGAGFLGGIHRHGPLYNYGPYTESDYGYGGGGGGDGGPFYGAHGHAGAYGWERDWVPFEKFHNHGKKCHGCASHSGGHLFDGLHGFHFGGLFKGHGCGKSRCGGLFHKCHGLKGGCGTGTCETGGCANGQCGNGYNVTTMAPAMPGVPAAPVMPSPLPAAPHAPVTPAGPQAQAMPNYNLYANYGMPAYGSVTAQGVGPAYGSVTAQTYTPRPTIVPATYPGR